MNPLLLAYLSAIHLNCESKDLIDTWLDDEDTKKKRIASLIFVNRDNKENEVRCSIEEPGMFGHTVVFIIKEFSVIFQSGMPDNMWYRKGDEECLLTLANQELFRFSVVKALQKALKKNPLNKEDYDDLQESEEIIELCENFTLDLISDLDNDQMNIIIQEEISKL